MNDLERYCRENTGRHISKWVHYFDIYDRHFARFRGKKVTIVEIGVFHGGSLQMWKHYFGDKARVVGVDINPECKAFEEDRIDIVIGDQSDRKFLHDLARQVGHIDILIDDGGHTMKQQIATFEELFQYIDNHGVYLCEDMHTSYWPQYEGGYRRSDTFVEYTKNLIDLVNAWHFVREQEIPDFTRVANSLHFYDSVLVIEKQPRQRPYDEQFEGKQSQTEPV